MTAVAAAYAKPLAICLLPATLLIAARLPAAAMCMIRTTPLNFGIVAADKFQIFPDVAVISYRCTRNMPMGIKLKLLRAQKGSARLRTMTNGKAELDYEITLDAGGHQLWGDGTEGTDFYFDAHPPVNQTVTVRAFAHIVRHRGPAVSGHYFDTLTVISEF